MTVRKSVFGSKEERKFYQKLQKTWSAKCNVYHNIPFLNVIDGKSKFIDRDYTVFELSDKEYDYLKKTSIDYVICDKDDHPQLGIEFDGMYQGINLGSKYKQSEKKSNNKRRKDKLELKLKVAHGSNFPLFVLSSDYFKGLSESIYLTIVDGIIGEVLSSKNTTRRVEQGFVPEHCGFSKEEFEEMTDSAQREIIQGWFDNISIESDFEINPIFRKVSEYQKQLNFCGVSYTYLNDPELDSESLDWVDCRVDSHAYGSAHARVCLPKFDSPGMYFGVHILHELAQLIALSELRKRMTDIRKK